MSTFTPSDAAGEQREFDGECSWEDVQVADNDGLVEDGAVDDKSVSSMEDSDCRSQGLSKVFVEPRICIPWAPQVIKKKRLTIPSIEKDGDLKCYKKKAHRYRALLVEMKEHVIESHARWESFWASMGSDMKAIYADGRALKSQLLQETKSFMTEKATKKQLFHLTTYSEILSERCSRQKLDYEREMKKKMPTIRQNLKRYIQRTILY
uniref:Uncharacterized protein n=1 Tax=Corethron hystrix TaxID=216773 RepID=A0A6U5M2Z7_9STRA|mmetsp:Transcript_8262/g.17966  ORF Transcript_8262/g.17966 Transcript_8262/m.17966 type:complete len:208 (+) Transcript_8262:53-676(+)